MGVQSSAGEISPNLYPKILSSISVKRQILEIIIPTDSINKEYGLYLNEKPISTYNLIKNYTLGLPSLLLIFFHKRK